MASDDSQIFPLLSLPVTVRDLLPPYVAAGEGGLQMILNFRRVCRDTERWLEDLPQLQAKRAFAKGQVTIEFEIEEIQKFLLTPPPFPVTSLKLRMAERLVQNNFSHLDSTMWNFFASFWSRRIEALDVDVLHIPPNGRLLQLVSSPGLRHLRCTSLRVSETFAAALAAADELANQPFEFPDFLLRLEELVVIRFGMTDDQKRFFFTRLSTSRNLKRLRVQMNSNAAVDGIRILIDRKKDDADFEVTIVHDLFLPQLLDDNYVSLVKSTAASVSKIHIVDLREAKVVGLQERVGEIVARKFFDCIEVIMSMNDGVERLANYRNLRVLYALRIIRGNLDGVEFPQNLQRLGLSGDIHNLPNLPGSLTCLSLAGFTCTVNELLESLNALSEMCPSLKNLAINWTSTKIRNDGSSAAARNPLRVNSDRIKFPHLKSLDFFGSYLEDDAQYSNQVILLEGFQLERLKLQELDLDGEIRRRRGYRQLKLDSNTLQPIVGGALAETLLTVRISRFSVAVEAVHLLETLQSIAAVNKAKRIETHGVK